MFTPLIDSALWLSIYMLSWFLLAQYLKNNSIVDIAYGMSYVLIAIGLFLFYANEWLFIMTLMVVLWGIRLSLHIGWRNILDGQEDWRYKKWRQEWGENVVIRAFFQVFVLQGVLIYMIALPIISIAYWPQSLGIGAPWCYIGIAFWLFGLLYESIADWQLKRFLQKPSNHGQILRKGLWKYHRHPNYFGEIVLWWGMALYAIGVTGEWWLVISPITISSVLIFISAPMLEAKHQGKVKYEQYYKETTSIFPKLF